MLTLTGDHIYLRALEPEDLEVLFTIENDESFWHLSDTRTPFSKAALTSYIKAAKSDIFEAKQLRLAICKNGNQSLLGFVDLFDFDPYHSRAGVGIIIHNKEYRQKGYALESLELVLQYAKTHIGLHQIYANILENNKASLALFEKMGFQLAGKKVDWHKSITIQGATQFTDEYMYQRML